MSDYDIHSCGYYCNRPTCIEAQRNELRDKLFSDQAVKTYSGGKPNYTQPDEAMMKRVMDGIPDMPIKAKIEKEPTIDGWPLWSGLPDWSSVEGIKREYGEGMVEKKVAITQDETVSIVCHESVAQYAQVNGLQKKEWVGLTDEDKNQIAKEAYNKVELTAWELAQRVGEFTEVKLKEKNVND